VIRFRSADMPEAAAANLLCGLSNAIDNGDANRARRRLADLNALLQRLPVESLQPIQQRLQDLIADAEKLRDALRGCSQDQHRQRRSVDAYRRIADQV
jgi:hypothetical protein